MPVCLTVATHNEQNVFLSLTNLTCYWVYTQICVQMSLLNEMYVSRLTLRRTVKAATIKAHFLRALGARRKLTLWPK